MRIKITDRCKVWDVNDENGRAIVRFSVSRKIKDGNQYDQIQIDNGVAKNGYISSNFSLVKFVGHAYHKLKDIQVGDVITNLEADLNNEPYWDTKNNCVAYLKNYKMTVFDFEKYNPENQEQNYTKNLDSAPKVADTPAAQTTYARPVQPAASGAPVQPVAPAPAAADECPF